VKQVSDAMSRVGEKLFKIDARRHMIRGLQLKNEKSRSRWELKKLKTKARKRKLCKTACDTVDACWDFSE